MAATVYNASHSLPHDKARKLAAASTTSNNTTLRSQRPRRQAAADPTFSYAEQSGSPSPEPSTRSQSSSTMSRSAMRRVSRTLSSSVAGSVDTRATSPSDGDRCRSSTPSEGSVQAPLTKTGRPSRALKGRKVHRCDICDRLYTRNEHLRRHQLNHSPEILRCPVDGCQKVFARDDLLKRHTAEHNDTESSSRRSSAPAHTNRDHRASLDAPLAAAAQFSSGCLPSSAWPVTADAADLSYSSSYIPDDRRLSHQWHDPVSSISSPEYPPNAPNNLDFIGGATYNLPDFTMPSVAQLPGEPMLGMDSISPSTSPDPAMFPWQQQNNFHHHQQPLAAPAAFSSPTSSDLSGASVPFIDVNAIMPSGKTFLEELDASEEAVVLKDVEDMAASMPGMHGQVRLERLEAQYLEAFWQKFDPAFSIIHRPTFEVYGTSPLVRSLMIAIGAHYFDDEAAMAMARTLRESCTKLVQRRPALDYSRSRLWDLQAVFLHEVFSIFCSRRPCSRFSQRFEDLLTGLLADRDNLYYATPLASLSELMHMESESLRFRWFDLESKRRLLLACYVLETQQNGLFGSHRPVSDRNLPVPCSSTLWQAYTTEDWQVACGHEPGDGRPLADMLAEAQTVMSPPLDTFTSHVAIAHGAHASYFGPYAADVAPRYPLASTAQVRFAYEAAQLACLAPVADLLAVSGETFALGQKLATPEQHEQAVAELRAWASGAHAAAAAQHAAALFRLSFEEARVGLLHEDWALALAALVAWAVGMWPRQYDVGAHARRAPVDHAEEKARAAAYGGGLFEYDGARACVAYTRRRIDGRLGWLVQDACGTLGKLVEGRIIDSSASIGA